MSDGHVYWLDGGMNIGNITKIYLVNHIKNVVPSEYPT